MFAHLPQLNSLRVFDSAARLGSFKAAALELNVTPTAVSHQIRLLEEKLGLPLFERRPRAIRLTVEGERLARVSHQSLQQLADVFEEISSKCTVLTLSTTEAFAAQWLVPRLEGFRQRFPEIEVQVKTSEQLARFGRDRSVDLAIRYGPLKPSSDLRTTLLTETFGMYATPQYLRLHPTLDGATLLETKWKNDALKPIGWKQCVDEPGAEHITPNVRQYDQEHHVIQAALAGNGIALISSLLVQTALEQGWLVAHPQTRAFAGFSYYLVGPANVDSSRKIERFVSWLRDETTRSLSLTESCKKNE